MVKIIHYKTCGILGGMGPYATVEFYRNILDNTSAKKDWDHIHILIDSNIYIPSRTRAVLYNESSPVPGMVDSINKMASIGADFVAVPCNSAHFFYKDVNSQIEVKWLNMLEVVAKKILRGGFFRPLVIGGYITTTKRIYSEFAPNAFYLANTENRFFEGIIEEVKLSSKVSEKSRKGIQEVLHKNKKKFDCIILACTEYSLISAVFGAVGVPFFDSSMIYAVETVKFAKEKKI
jgi:aspartate racemase